MRFRPRRLWCFGAIGINTEVIVASASWMEVSWRFLGVCAAKAPLGRMVLACVWSEAATTRLKPESWRKKEKFMPRVLTYKARVRLFYCLLADSLVYTTHSVF